MDEGKGKISPGFMETHRMIYFSVYPHSQLQELLTAKIEIFPAWKPYALKSQLRLAVSCMICFQELAQGGRRQACTLPFLPKSCSCFECLARGSTQLGAKGNGDARGTIRVCCLLPVVYALFRCKSTGSCLSA